MLKMIPVMKVAMAEAKFSASPRYEIVIESVITLNKIAEKKPYIKKAISSKGLV